MTMCLSYYSPKYKAINLLYKENDMVEKFLDKNNKVYMLPKKYNMRMEVLEFFISKFEKDKLYSEKEVNEIINEHHTFNDACRVRRELYDAKFLGRTKQGDEYWREK